MSEAIYDTSISYVENCRRSSVAPSPFVQAAFQRLKDELMFEEKENVQLKLCANNKLVNPKNLRLDDDDAKVLCQTLRNNELIAGLDLRYNRIGDEGAKAVAELLAENKTLTLLNLTCNEIGEAGAAAIAKALLGNETLLELSLAGNKIGDAGGLRFAEALQVNFTLESLDLGDCDLRIDAVIAMATVLGNNNSLRALNVSRPLLWTQQEETSVHMGEMLCRNRCLRQLHLAKYEMRDFGAARIADGLASNRHITVLDLSCNRITRDGAKVLAKVLATNPPLQVLDLSYNRLECDGAKSVASALIGANTNLRSLAVKFNEIKDDGLVALADSLKYNVSLNCLYVWGNQLGRFACAALGEILEAGRLRPECADVRAYEVDGETKLAQLSHDLDFRLYRWSAPVFGDGVPEDSRFALS